MPQASPFTTMRMQGDDGAPTPGERRRTAGRQRSSKTAAAPPAGQIQAVYEAMGEESQSTSTWSRASFAKARQSETSASQLNGPCFRPVAISITVQLGSQIGMPRKWSERW